MAIQLHDASDYLTLGLLGSADGPTAGTGLRGPLRVDGQFFVDATGATVRPLLASALAILAQPPDARDAALDELVGLGFNGVRVFAGDLGWAGQTPESARAALPGLLAALTRRGMLGYICAITGGRNPVYDIEAHLAAVANLCAAYPLALLEGANEIGHPTLAEKACYPPWLRATLRRLVPPGLLWTLGAPLEQDEPDAVGDYPTVGGAFNDAHLDRGRDKWNQVRRLRELAAVREAVKTPMFNGEMMGADEQMGGVTGTKQRRNDPDFFFAAGALSRGFELATVFHSEDGLNGRRLRPVTRQCAEAFVAGFRAVETADRLQFQNAGWAGSPVAGANFDRVVRCYSFVAGGHGYTALVGVTGQPNVQWGGGWRPTARVTNFGEFTLVGIER